MIVATMLFLTGILIGFFRGYPAILLASIIVTLVAFPLWLVLDELELFSILVWIGYLFALQSGFMVGSYLGVPGDES